MIGCPNVGDGCFGCSRGDRQVARKSRELDRGTKVVDEVIHRPVEPFIPEPPDPAPRITAATIVGF